CLDEIQPGGVAVAFQRRSYLSGLVPVAYGAAHRIAVLEQFAGAVLCDETGDSGNEDRSHGGIPHGPGRGPFEGPVPAPAIRAGRIRERCRECRAGGRRSGSVPGRWPVRFFPGSRASPGLGRVPGRQGAPDQDALDVARTLVDLAHAHVAVDAFDGEVRDIAVAAEGLDRVRADALGHLRG